MGNLFERFDQLDTTLNRWLVASEVLEVSPYDLSVTAPVPGRDMVTLQTCIENFGDYWTPGPNWLARYVVRADRVA